MEHHGRDQHCDHSWELHVDGRARHDGGDAGDDDDLHADGNERYRLSDGYDNGDGGWVASDDHFVYGQSSEYHFRIEQHAELCGPGSDERYDFAGRVYFDGCKRLDERDAHGDYDLHVDGNECGRLGNGHGNGDGNCAASDDRFVYSQPGQHCLGIEQHAELCSHGRDERYDYAREFHVHGCKRLTCCDAHGNDDLHVDGDECGRISDGHGDGDCGCGASEVRFVHLQPAEHSIGNEQYAGIFGHGRDKLYHYAGNVHVHREWHTGGDADGYDHLYADGDECGRLNEV